MNGLAEMEATAILPNTGFKRANSAQSAAGPF